MIMNNYVPGSLEGCVSDTVEQSFNEVYIKRLLYLLLKNRKKDYKCSIYSHPLTFLKLILIKPIEYFIKLMLGNKCQTLLVYDY